MQNSSPFDKSFCVQTATVKLAENQVNSCASTGVFTKNTLSPSTTFKAKCFYVFQKSLIIADIKRKSKNKLFARVNMLACLQKLAHWNFMLKTNTKCHTIVKYKENLHDLKFYDKQKTEKCSVQKYLAPSESIFCGTTFCPLGYVSTSD